MRLWHLLFGLSLIAALAGTPARQAEAAADLARTMAELGGGDSVEEEDGGVGDDALEAPRIDAAADPAADLAPGDAAPAPAADPLEPPPASTRRPATASRPTHPTPPGRKFAWLQRFLF